MSGYRHKTESTWQQGFDAERRGEPFSANPYSRDRGLDYKGWANGYRWAERSKPA